jgi:hypothetical protein
MKRVKDTARVLQIIVSLINNFLDVNDWDSLRQNKIKALTNKCHTLMRDQCFDEDSNYHIDESKLERKTMQAHLYYNAPKCVIDTIGSGFIFMKYTLLLGVISFITLF